MKRKYVMGGGLAFSEEEDMMKLKKYAKEGWIFTGITAGFWYRFEKGEPQDLDFSVDYQTEADEDYFSLFAEAGWNRVVSADNIHIFSAPEGTKPIYSDQSTTIEKYQSIKKQMGTGAGIFLIATSLTFLAFKMIEINYVNQFFFIMFLLTLILFIFCAMPYAGYVYRLRKLKRDS